VASSCVNGGVHAAAQATDGSVSTHLLADGFDRLLDECGAAPLGIGFTYAEKEISQNLRATLGVIDLWMKLNHVNLAVLVFGGGNGTGSAAGGMETRW
jgi:hypothetical protein